MRRLTLWCNVISD